MNLGNNLFQARKKAGLSQESVAEKLGVSRQTISKWETDETIPDIYQSKKLAKLYNLTLDELIDFDIDIKEIEEIIKNTDEEKESKINWTNAWSKKYPVLKNYTQQVDISKYSTIIRKLLNSLKDNYGFNELDSMLVLKDILYHEWKDNK
ncbi:MAG TPA: helix-turn-helix transcriptional regulator [Candidatus Onthocola stercoravium]|nr:helix-turn-helix transcriptional regulator [Candidatus Onthocola stercoravium]